MKKQIQLCVFLLILIYAVLLTADPVPNENEMMFRLNLYEGFRGESHQAVNVISSFYLKHLSLEKVCPDIDVSKEQKALKRVFNLSDIKLMTQTDMCMEKEKSKSPFQMIIHNNRKLLVQLTPIHGKKNQFRVQVEMFEDKKSRRSLLETKIILPEEKSATLGFEDSGSHIYFLSFHRCKDIPLSPLLPHSREKNQKNLTKDIKRPHLIRKVDPEYPEAALGAKVEGKVIISATANGNGDVVEAKVLNGHPLLREPSLEAIKQWKYEPYVIDGVKKPVKFKVVLTFRLPSKKQAIQDQPLILSMEQRPKIIKKIAPVYPEDALDAGVTGKVVLEATIDTQGNVVEAKIIDGHPLLNTAALETIKQWKYEVYTVKGKKKSVKFTVVVNFKLKHRKKQGP